MQLIQLLQAYVATLPASKVYFQNLFNVLKNIPQFLLVIVVTSCSPVTGRSKFQVDHNYEDVYYNILTGVRNCTSDTKNVIRNSIFTYKPFAEIVLTGNPFLTPKTTYLNTYNYIYIEGTGDGSAEVTVNNENTSSLVNLWANGNYICNTKY